MKAHGKMMTYFLLKISSDKLPDSDHEAKRLSTYTFVLQNCIRA